MQPEENKLIVGRFFEELWNERKLGVADEIFADECVTHQLQSGEEISAVPRNADAVKEHVGEWLAAFPDLHFSVEQTVAENDTVVSRCSLHGTHAGRWHSVAPTGKKVSVRMIVIHRIADKKIVEDWVVVESFGFFQQLGLVPPIQEILAGAAK